MSLVKVAPLVKTHILNMHGKVCGFMKKIKLWERNCEDGAKKLFPAA
jgi:hypothetical protein